MGENSKIEWTHHTFNPWWGCEKVSEGCANCYAESLSKRTGNKIWGRAAPRKFFGDEYWNKPLKWNERAESEGVRKRVFCASMADVFEDRDDLVPQRRRLFDLILSTPRLDWLLLTKRTENLARLLPVIMPVNIWLGTSAENQEAWDRRVPILLRQPALIHFVSAEPLLGAIELNGQFPDWIIVGGESGPRARKIEEDWVLSLMKQCASSRCSFFFKQWGGVNKKRTGRELIGRTFDDLP